MDKPPRISFPYKILPLESNRLIFKHFTADDLEFVHRFHNVPGVYADPNVVLPLPLENSEAWLMNQLNSYENEGTGHIKAYLKESGEFVGRNGLRIVEIVKGNNGTKDAWYWYRGSAPKDAEVEIQVELGYAFLPEHWNKGYATESTDILCKKAFKEGMAEKIVAAVHAENLASAKVLEKCGFKPTGEVTGLGMDLIGYCLVKT